MHPPGRTESHAWAKDHVRRKKALDPGLTLLTPVLPPAITDHNPLAKDLEAGEPLATTTWKDDGEVTHVEPEGDLSDHDKVVPVHPVPQWKKKRNQDLKVSASAKVQSALSGTRQKWVRQFGKIPSMWGLDNSHGTVLRLRLC